MPQFIPLENDLKRVVNSAPLIIFQVDRNGIFTLSEGAALKIIGSSPGKNVGRSIYEMFSNNPKIINSYEHVLRTGEDYQYSVKISDSVFFETKLTAIKQDNVIVGVNGVSTDISEQRFLENKLRESEEHYKNLMDSAPLGILIIQNLITQYVNDKLASIFGFNNVSEFLGKPSIELFSPEVRESLQRRFQNRENGIIEPKSYETIGLKISGEKFPLRITVEKVSYLGNPAQMAFFQDITEEKKADEQRKIIEKQLMQTQKLESLGVLAGGIAHDFNNLLVGIMGNASLAFNEITPDSPIYEYIVKIEKSSKLASDLTKQMLNYSGKGQFQKEVFSFKDLIAENEHLFKAAISKSHELKFQIENDLPLIELDSTQIYQVILNLLSNASEAINHSHGVITVSLTKGFVEQDEITSPYQIPLPRGSYLVLSVQDNGKGIDKANFEKIFDPFFTTKTTGRGLGLAVVLGIVKGHNGAIKLDSEIDKGTKFSIYLPIKDGLIKEKPKVIKTNIKETKRGTVLICDDEEAVLDVASKMLTGLGYKTLIAHDGIESVNLFLKHYNVIDLILLDLTMPNMGGEEVLFKIREINPNIKIIISSGYNENEVMVKFSDKKQLAFLQKPYSYPELINVVNQLLSK